jgi:hypothetical protein
MAEDEIIFRIKVMDEGGELAALEGEIARIGKARDELSKKIKAGNQLTADEARQYEQLNRQLIAVRNQRKEMQQTMERETKAAQLNAKSLAAMRAELAAMRKEFEKLDPASKESDVLARKIHSLQVAINRADFATGNFRANVGNYTESVIGAIRQSGLFSGQLGGLGKIVSGLVGGIGGAAGGGVAGGLTGALGAMGLSMMALPFAAVTAGFKLLQSYFSSNEERAFQFKSVMTGLRGVFDDLRTSTFKAMDGIGSFFDNFAQGLAMVLGGVEGAARYQTRQILAKTQMETQKALKDLEVQYAKEQIEISELRVKAAEKDKYSAKQREEFLKQAIEKEKAYTEKRVAYLKQIADIEESLQKMSDSSAEDVDRLREMRKAQYNAESEFNSKSRAMASQMSEFRQQVATQEKQQHEDWKKRQLEKIKLEKKYRQIEELVLNSIKEDAQKEWEELTKPEEDPIIKKIKEQMKLTRELQQLKKSVGEEQIEDPELEKVLKKVDTYDTIKKKLKEQKLGYKELSDAIRNAAVTEAQRVELSIQLAEMEAAARKNAIAEITTTGMKLFKEDSLAYKVFASAQAVMATYEAAAKALKYPYPFNFILEAMIIAEGLANVAKINAVKFQEGGVLQGPSHSEGGIPVRIAGGRVVEAEGGELIVNKNIWTRPDFVAAISEMNYRTGGKKFASGGILPSDEANIERIVSSIVSEIAAIPVVVSEKDITSTQRKVQVINKLGKI